MSLLAAALGLLPMPNSVFVGRAARFYAKMSKASSAQVPRPTEDLTGSSPGFVVRT